MVFISFHVIIDKNTVVVWCDSMMSVDDVIFLGFVMRRGALNTSRFQRT